ncbi:MAG: DEAD/DEAH box helicase [Acidimicrobiales bacterium]
MNIFDLRQELVADYGQFIRGFLKIRDAELDAFVQAELSRGVLWPEPWISLNPNFEPGGRVDDLVADGLLHDECRRVFRIKSEADPNGSPLRLHRHQADAMQAAASRDNYVLTTGTGSGKSLAYILPIVDRILRDGPGNGIKALVVYPMNALANSQANELRKFLSLGYPDGRCPITFRRYTGQEREEERREIIADPPDVLLTNYVMAELILTRVHERGLVRAANGLRFLVLDELHTYRGRQGADVALLVRRIRDACNASDLQCIGTSATLASGGTFDDQRIEVAAVATRLFGDTVNPERVIGETLRRAISDHDFTNPSVTDLLRDRVLNPDPPFDFDALNADPLASWIETTFGLRAGENGRLVRARPLTITGDNGAAAQLARLCGVDNDAAAAAIRAGLLAGCTIQDPDTRRPVFAFRLHQFVTRGDTVYAALGHSGARHVTMQAQRLDPTDPASTRILLPLVFCRECGQDYYSVARVAADDNLEHGAATLLPRALGEQDPEQGEAAFLHLSADNPFPSDDYLERLPDDWIEEDRNGLRRVRRDRQDWVPRPVGVHPDGTLGSPGEPGTLAGHLVPTPFRFCLHCGVAYSFTTRSDISKLTTLGLEGRSTATTMLSLSILRYLRTFGAEAGIAQKLLTFSDNRQDASLQAGHFNDFIQVSLLRTALYNAVDAASGGLTHEALAPAVYDALGLDIGEYAMDPDVRFAAREDTDRALREVLAYRLYTDLRRGWRVTAPNLEQAGLLRIDYRSLPEACGAEDLWTTHPVLADAEPAVREHLARALLDFMRRELAVRVDYLDAGAQEQLVQRSNQHLIAPWGLDENEQDKLERATVLVPRGRRPRDDARIVQLSARSNFGRFVRRTLNQNGRQVSVADTELLIPQLLDALRQAGLVTIVREDRDDVPGYQVSAAALIWRAGDGTAASHDPIRVPHAPEAGLRTNAFFVGFYRHVAATLRGLVAKEHTAQVPNDERERREDAFRENRLPLLFCSPTMELGIDIADLNVVGMRNVPPTPSNYAQRSGRAGRSGQPALVTTYCSTGSSHDQYFFRRPTLMVSGQVNPPRLDLANEDLIRSHVHAIWLAETGIDLRSSLRDILDHSGDNPSLELLPSVRSDIDDPTPRARARARAERVLASLDAELNDSDWWNTAWLDDTLNAVRLRFEGACDRWRTLFRAAKAQWNAQNAIIGDASRPQRDKQQATRLRAEAEAQLGLLTNDDAGRFQSDFYSYRYFASEGFLPGYNFPRLPLSAFIPARRRRTSTGDDFLSRPRFLAISEFGPRSFVYHEGSRYVINRVILPVGERQDGHDRPLRTSEAKQCQVCGYMHPLEGGATVDVCRFCATELGATMANLFRMQNVSARRTERINSDEEERARKGYEVRTGFEFAQVGGRLSYRVAEVAGSNGEALVGLTYGERATLWRINLGWSRRDPAAGNGFRLDVERGYWQRAADDTDPDDPLSPRVETVVPYVEDRRNALIVRPQPLATIADHRDRLALAAALRAALKNAIQVEYNLEDSELAAELLPARNDSRMLLLYEASEGGAGVLRRLIDDTAAVADVARRALEICHFDPETGDDLHRAPGAAEDCVAACYDCLLSYTNQPDHRLVDRRLIRDFLRALTTATVDASPVAASREEHRARLDRLSDTRLERQFLDLLDRGNHRLPAEAQALIREAGTKPDFVYWEECVAVYVDGPHHRFPDRVSRDRTQQRDLEDLGWTVLRLADDGDWQRIIDDHPGTFGRPT